MCLRIIRTAVEQVVARSFALVVCTIVLIGASGARAQTPWTTANDAGLSAPRAADGNLPGGQASHATQPPLPLNQPKTPLHIVPFLGGQSIQRAMPGLFAPPGTHMTYFGGRVISTIQIVQVLYGPGAYLANVSSTSPPSVASFFTDVTQSSYMDLLNQYSSRGVVPADGGPSSDQVIGHGFFDGQFSITPSAVNNGSVITDSQIQAELLDQVTAGNLPAPVLDAQGNNTTLYMIYFPPGKTIKAGTLSSCASGGFCAYHSSTVGKFGNQSLYYGVLPDMQPPSACSSGCGSTDPFQNVTIVSSHELAEAMTDADVGTAAAVDRPLAWIDPNTGAEIGDVCTGLPAIINPNGTTYFVQQEWSNLQNNCASGPVTYSFEAPLSPVPGAQFDLTVNASSSPASSSPLANYRGTVHFTSSDPAAVLPADYTYTFADAGSHTFVVTLNGSGTQMITATDTQFPFTGTATLQVQQPKVFFLLVTTPENATAGSPVGVVVTAADATFNPVTSYDTTLHFTSSDPAAVLPPDSPLVNGTGTFFVTFNTATSQNLAMSDLATPTLSAQRSFSVFTPGANSTTTTVDATPNPSVFGQPVTYTATVTGGTTPLIGSVSFNLFGSAPLDANGHAQAILTLPAGIQTVFGEYGGTNQLSSSAPFTAIINPAPTTIALTSSQSSGKFGDPVTFTATISPSSINGTFNSGVVTFSDGPTPIAVLSAQFVTNSVTASFTTSSLPVGQHTITASFAGTTSFAPSTSAPLVQTVNPAGAPDYSLAASATSATVLAGQTANFSLDATSLNGFTGTLKFSCGNLPALTSCAFLPSTEFLVTAGTAPVILNVKTTGTHASLFAPPALGRDRPIYAALWGFTPFACGMVLLFRARRKARPGILALAFFCLFTLAALTSCGGGSPPPPPPPPPPPATPAGTSTFTVITTATPASGPAITTTKQLNLTVTVTP